MRTQIEIRQEITARIVEALASGTLPPWKRPWANDSNCGAHANAVSSKRYSGVNPLLLQIAAERHNFTSKWWATFRQWKELGGSVMKRPTSVPEGQSASSRPVQRRSAPSRLEWLTMPVSPQIGSGQRQSPNWTGGRPNPLAAEAI